MQNDAFGQSVGPPSVRSPATGARLLMSVSEFASAVSGVTTNTFVLLAGEIAYVTSPSGSSAAVSASATACGSPFVGRLLVVERQIEARVLGLQVDLAGGKRLVADRSVGEVEFPRHGVAVGLQDLRVHLGDDLILGERAGHADDDLALGLGARRVAVARVVPTRVPTRGRQQRQREEARPEDEHAVLPHGYPSILQSWGVHLPDGGHPSTVSTARSFLSHDAVQSRQGTERYAATFPGSELRPSVR